MATKLYRISDQIAASRKNSGLTISKLAQHASVSRPTVRSTEKGCASIKSMMGVIGALNTTICSGDGPVGNLGALLASQRNQRRLPQRELAKRLGVTQATIVALEVHNRGGMETLEKYLEVLEIDLVLRPQKQARKRQLIPAKNNAESDIVYTPAQLVSEILSQLPLNGCVLDPCKGDGAFFDQFPTHVNACWCELDRGRDFFEWEQRVDWIVTNPPWSKFRAFLEHAMHISDNVVFLAAFSHFSTKARVRDIRKAGFAMRKIIYVPTPADWPASGFQLAAVWLQRGWSGACEIVHVAPSDP